MGLCHRPVGSCSLLGSRSPGFPRPIFELGLSSRAVPQVSAKTSSTAVSHQAASFSITHLNAVNLGPSTPSLSSPSSASAIIMLQLSMLLLDISDCLRCQPFSVQITFSRRMRGSVHGTFIARRIGLIAISLRRSSSEFAECACTRTASGFLKCVVARSATMLILLARTELC